MAASDEVLKVADLVSTASLNVRVLAGEAGIGREVLWAHSCELSDPERWLGPHELLMTVGLCVPAEPEEQAAFVGRLDDAGLAGIMIGDHDTAPAITRPLLEEADRRGFPVLSVVSETPFAVVARHVASGTSSAQIQQVLKLSKLYQVATNADDDAAALVRDLVSLLGVGIRVEDRLTGLTIVEANPTVPAGQLLETRSYPLRGTYEADLHLAEFPREPLDGFLLVHLLKVLEVNIDRIMGAFTHWAERSARAMTGLLNGTVTAEAEELLGDVSLADGFQVAAFGGRVAPHVARGVVLQRMTVIVGRSRVAHLALIPHRELARFREFAEGTGKTFGVSSTFTDLRDVRSAAEEAGRVRSAGRHGGRSWVEFEGTTISVLARSQREAEEIVVGVLGPLADPDGHADKLRETLFAFLRNDRRWRETAEELGVHRQTLSYRLKRIEEETGLDVSSSADLSSMWIAYQAWQQTRT